MFKKSDGAEGADYKYTNPETIYAESSSARHITGDKKTAPAMLGASIRIKGELSGDEDLIIQGHVEGTIELKQNNLTVGAQGSVKANSRARIITIEGKVEGDLFGEERIVIKHSGDVRGNIVAPRVSLEDGAKFKGSIDMEPKNAKASSISHDTRAPEKSADTVGNAASARGAKDNASLTGVHAKTA